jgi:hypothetical protein
MPTIASIRSDLRTMIEAIDVTVYAHGRGVTTMIEEASGSIDEAITAWPHLTYILRTTSTRAEEKTRTGHRVTTQFELLIAFEVRPAMDASAPASRELDDCWTLAEVAALAVTNDAGRNWSALWSDIDVVDPPDEGRTGALIRFALNHPFGA